ncbi:xanthine dehydrogenase family protein subunit M [soil metagenome]
MKTFAFEHATTVEGAVATVAATGGKFYAGGTNLLDLMKGGVDAPPTLVDVRRLGLQHIVATPTGGVMIGGTVTNSAIANHPLIRSQYPVLSQSILSGATTQLRNMATAGGNLMQRTRCPYFMDTAFVSCNKRQPGTGCAAKDSFNREHAVFGASDACVAIHPSDMAVALVILGAAVHVHGPDGARVVPIADFFRLPGDTPHLDNVLAPADLIVGIELLPSGFARHSWYLKVRDRHSYAFALVSVAVGLKISDGVIRDAAIALGGVAARPWRVADAETTLIGSAPTEELFRQAGRIAMAGAVPLSQNGFKVDLGRHSVVRALTQALGVLP